MTYDTTFERHRHAGGLTGAKPALVAALLGVIVLIGVSETQAPAPQDASATSIGEDWHGNVRHSGWPN